jgi:fibronectin-binding autotransporter adhesin
MAGQTFVRAAVAAAALTALARPPASATTYSWNGSVTNGNFQSAANWSPNTGFPGIADTAIFNVPLGPSYAVSFTGSVTNTGMQLTQGFWAFGLAPGQTYAVTGTNQFQMGSAGTLANLKITGGGTFSVPGNLSNLSGIGGQAGSSANLTVDGAGTAFTAASGLAIGYDGGGSLTVQNGATATFSGQAAINIDNGSTGAVNVGNTGTGTLTVNGPLAVGNGGTAISNGILSVGSGGTVTDSAAVTIALSGSVTSNGTWNQTAGLISVAGGTMTLGGGALTTTTAGTGITVSSGTFNVTGGNHTVLNLTRSGAGAVNLTNGSLTVTGTFANGNAPLTVVGNVSSDSPSLVLDGGASASGITGVTVGNTNRGSLAVENGSTLNATTLTLGSAGGPGTATVNGANSKILLTGGGTSYVGFSAVGSLVINGASTATLNTGNGSLYAGFSAGSSGSIDVNGGTLALGTGTLTIGHNGTGSLLLRNGGSITQSQFAVLGDAPGGVGTALVTGATWSTGAMTVGFAGGSGTLTVQSGGSINTSLASAVGYSGGTGTLNLNGGSWSAAAGLVVGDPTGGGGNGVVNVNPGGSFTATGSSTLTLAPGGTVNLAGGSVTAAGITAQGGRLAWSSGLLSITGAGGLTLDNLTFGSGISLGASQALNVTGTLTVPATQPLTLAGGSITTGSIAGPGSINTQTGSLQITNSGLTIGSGNPLGAVVTIGLGLSLRVTGAAQSFAVAADGVLNLTGGTVTAGLMTNAGEIDFGSPVAVLGNTGQQLTNTGRMAGTGRVNANLINNANGRVSVDAGQRLVFAGATNNNQTNGTIELTGGTVEFTGSLNNNSGALISGRGTFRGSSANTSGVGLINIGAVAFSGGTSDIYGKVTNSAGGQIITAGGGLLTFHDDVVHNGAEIRTVAGSRTVFVGAESGAGPFTGTGPVEFDGDLRPGNSPASVPFGGDLVLTNTTNLQAQIGGATLGSQYDHLQVAGQVTFAGNLDAQLINGFTPTVGQRFDVVTFGSRSGSFNSFTGLNFGGGLQFTADYDASHFYLAVTPNAGGPTWTGTTSGLWNDPSNWAPTGVPTSGSNTQLNFGTTPNAAMTNDVPGGLILNRLTFFTPGPVFTLGGNGLDFRTNGSAILPQIVLTSASGFTITAPLTLTNNLTVSGVGSLALNGPISGSGSLTNAGPTVLTLGGNANTYAGGTIVNSGTIRTTAVNALPAGSPVSVIAGTLDLNGFNQAIGTLTLSDPTTFGLSPRPIISSASAAVLTLGGNVTCVPGTGSPSALIATGLNLGGATRTVTVTAASGDPYDVVITGHVTGTGGLTKAGPGSLVLTNTNSYTGATTISGGIMDLVVVNALPSTSPVVLSGTGQVTASPAASTAEVTAGNYNQLIGSIAGPAGTGFTLLAGTLTVGGDSTNAVFNGTLNLPGTTLVKIGTGTQTLGGTNNQSTTTVNGGTLAVTTDAALGSAVSPVTVNAFGTLTYFGSTTSTGRAFTLNSGTLTVAAGQTATLNNSTVAGGFVAGPGALAVTGGTVLAGATTSNSAVVSQTGGANFVNFTNGGALNLAPGLSVPGSFTRFTNQGSGSIAVGAVNVLNVNDFQTYGTLTLAPAAVGSGQFTRLNNAGTSPMSFNGGSRTFIGTAATAGQNLALVDLHGQNAIVAGGLFINNGFVGDSTAGGATIVADFGSLVKGAGTYQNSVITQNGGKFQAGNSPGKARFGELILGPGGTQNYIWQINNATGVAGPLPDANNQVSGWSLLSVEMTMGIPGPGGPTPGNLNWSATSVADTQFNMALQTLINPITVGQDTRGAMANFDPAHSYAWPFVTWQGSYTGPTTDAALTSTVIFDTTNVVNPVQGTFSLHYDAPGKQIDVVYTPVPEPGTFVLLAVAALPLLRRLSHRATTQPAAATDKSTRLPGSGTAFGV